MFEIPIFLHTFHIRLKYFENNYIAIKVIFTRDFCIKINYLFAQIFFLVNAKTDSD